MPFELDVVKNVLRVSGLNLRYVEKTGSTNADLLCDGATKRGDVLIAGSQTKGRGRMDRRFASPDGGLYMSVMLNPESSEEALLITPRAAVAVARAIENVSGKQAGIKWVNDIFIDGKKISGILAEARGGERLDVVLGIGINVSAAPEGMESIAGAIFETPPAYAREILAAEILNEFFCGGYNVYEEYTGRCIVLNQNITVTQGAASYAARAVAIDSAFRLVVELSDGIRRTLDSGEISVRL